MELVNNTPVPASVNMSGEEGAEIRTGMLFAKATYSVDDQGRTELVSQDPYPLLAQEEFTDLGILPRDVVHRTDAVFEVILLGAAYGDRGQPLPSRMVELSVGDVRRQLAVYGDRTWLGNGDERKISEPAPFDRMPLTWERAFGGMCEAHLDATTVVAIEDPMNKYGRGFDPQPMANLMGQVFKPPEGFPRVDYARPLPNLEDPNAPIATWDATPEPCCWATVPTDIGFCMSRQLEDYQSTKELPDPEVVWEMSRHQAHPGWLIPLPAPGTPVTLIGMTPSGVLSFQLPLLRVIADYVLGERTGQRELAPQMLVLLPEKRRFYLVYRAGFSVEAAPPMNRSFRLRLEAGWFRHPEPMRADHSKETD